MPNHHLYISWRDPKKKKKEKKRKRKNHSIQLVKIWRGNSCNELDGPQSENQENAVGDVTIVSGGVAPSSLLNPNQLPTSSSPPLRLPLISFPSHSRNTLAHKQTQTQKRHTLSLSPSNGPSREASSLQHLRILLLLSLPLPPHAISLVVSRQESASEEAHPDRPSQDQGDLHAGPELHYDGGQDRLLDQVRGRQALQG